MSFRRLSWRSQFLRHAPPRLGQLHGVDGRDEPGHDDGEAWRAAFINPFFSQRSSVHFHLRHLRLKCTRMGNKRRKIGRAHLKRGEQCCML
jgi:hypothetical protein